MKRRLVLLVPAVLPMLGGCYYPQYFDVTWDEDVVLHDGTVIAVRLTFQCERLDRFSEFDRSMLRATTLIFDAGPPHGRVTQVFRGMQPVLLDRFEGRWYAVIEPRGAGDIPALTGQDWGPLQNGRSQRCVRLEGLAFRSIPISELPEATTRANLVHGIAPKDMHSLDGTRITLEQSRALLERHVLRDEDRWIRRPRPSTADPHRD